MLSPAEALLAAGTGAVACVGRECGSRGKELSSAAFEIRQVSHQPVCFLNLGNIKPKVFSSRNPFFLKMSMHFLFDLLVVAATN